MEFVFSKSTETVLDSFSSTDPLWLLFRLETAEEKQKFRFEATGVLSSFTNGTSQGGLFDANAVGDVVCQALLLCENSNIFHVLFEF